MPDELPDDTRPRGPDQPVLPAAADGVDQPPEQPAVGESAPVDRVDQPSEQPAAGAPAPSRPYERFDCSDDEGRATGLEVALASLARDELVVVPTDTVYGLAVDAFSTRGVTALLSAKGRGRDMPVPVLVATLPMARALMLALGAAGELLVEEFWPGPLTIVCSHQPSLRWDLGDARGTVAVRMPNAPLALELIGRHGPLAVSSANRSGRPPASTCDAAVDQLGDAVAVYLDGGPSGQPAASTIVDLTGPLPRILREGALSVDRLREVVPDMAGLEPPTPP